MSLRETARSAETFRHNLARLPGWVRRMRGLAAEARAVWREASAPWPVSAEIAAEIPLPAPGRKAPRIHPLVAPYKPRVLILQINKRCNLLCGFCDHHKFELEMSLADALRVVDDAADCGIRALVITGGEPFLHKGIFTLIAHAKSHGLGVNITTNGTTLTAHAEQVAASGVDSLSISLDGPGELHDEIRGRPGTRKKIEAGIAALKRTSRMPDINIYTVVTKRNIQHLDELYREATAQGFHFNFWPVNNAPEMYLTDPADVARYLDFCKRVTASDSDFKGRMAYYRRGMDYHAGKTGRARCLGVSDQIGVAVDGTVIPCCVWGEEEKLKIGSIRDSTLRAILASPATAESMRQLYGHGCSVNCYNHSLYEFEIATGEASVVA